MEGGEGYQETQKGNRSFILYCVSLDLVFNCQYRESLWGRVNMETKVSEKGGNKRYYRNLFLIGALWNWVATLVFFFFYEQIFSIFGMEPPLYPANLQLFLALAFVFGIGYFWVSRDISINHDIVKMGIIGKVMVFLLFLYHSFFGNLVLAFAAIGTVDLLFAILFLEFLIRFHRGYTH